MQKSDFLLPVRLEKAINPQKATDVHFFRSQDGSTNRFVGQEVRLKIPVSLGVVLAHDRGRDVGGG